MRKDQNDCLSCDYAKYNCPLWLADLTKDGELVHNYEFSCPLEKEKENNEEA
mgnify:CR=1 FL=1